MNNMYIEDMKINPDHVATPRWVVESIYNLIHIEQFKNIWFPFNNYDSEFKLKADELSLKYKATHIFDDLEHDYLNCKKENTNLKEALKKIREYIESDSATIGYDYYENIKYLREECCADDILQIIYETIGDDESETKENS